MKKEESMMKRELGSDKGNGQIKQGREREMKMQYTQREQSFVYKEERAPGERERQAEIIEREGAIIKGEIVNKQG